jgi:predicted GIY-YIG superfamily endonuclease
MTADTTILVPETPAHYNRVQRSFTNLGVRYTPVGDAMQLALQLDYERQERIAGQPIIATYLHNRLPYTVQVLSGKFAGDSLVYLLHFEQPYQHTRHYIGSTNDLERRLQEHQRKHPNFMYQGKRYRRYSTILKALSQQYSEQELEQRKFELLCQTRRDRGVSLLMAINRANIPWQIVQVWQADRSFEFYLKRQKHAGRFCPVCTGTHQPF